MTEAMPIDVSGKVISNTKPAAPGSTNSPTAPKPPDKAGDPPPAPGSKTFLGWVAASFSRKQLTIAAAAVCSLVAGIAAVRLIWPDEEPPPSATTALVSEPQNSAAPAAPVTPPRTGPTLTIDPPKPAEFIPPASLPMSPTAPATAIPAPSGLDSLPAIPTPGATPSAPLMAAGPAAPVSPSSPAASPPSSLPAIPSPSSLVPDVVPAGGADNKPPASPTSLPAIPSTPPSTLPAAPASGPLLPALPGTPSIAPPGSASSESKPPAPIVGLPPKPPESLAPTHETAPKLPASSAELSPKLPATPAPGGAKIEFVKPPESTTPAAATRPPTTSYDVDIYHPKANDSWEAISREYYSDTKYAAVLRAYNQNRALTPGREVDVPPLHVLRRMTPPPVTGAAPGRPTPAAGGDPWNAAGVGTVSARTYRVPPGDGMSLPAVAKLVLGNDQRWRELYDLNPDVNPSKVSAGTELKLPADARVQ